MATVKISDLSVGDWVEFHRTRGIYIAPPLFDHANAQVIGTHRGAEVSLLVDGKREFIAMPLSAIRPIPITAEILEKNGFTKKNYDNGKMLDWCCDNILVRKFADEDFYRFIVAFNSEHYTTMMVVVKHTHQMQQALRLAGVDKEINL